MRVGGDWSVRKRLTLIASIVMGLFCVGGCALILYGLHGLQIYYKIDMLLRSSSELIPLIREDRVPPLIHLGPGMHGQVIDPRGRVVSGTPGMRDRPIMSHVLDRSTTVRSNESTCASPAFPDQCVIIAGYRLAAEGGGEWQVYAATDAVPWYIDSQAVIQLGLGSALLILLTATGTWRIVSNTLAPVEAIRAELSEIKGSDIGRRVPVPATNDEVRALAQTVNQTLDRLEAVVQAQRRFASDASHDLRSPVTAMRAQVEEALLHPEDTDWTAIALAQLESLERLEALIGDLLMLARLDAGAPGRHEVLDLSALVTAELEHRSRQVQVIRHLQPGVRVNGDRLRLARLLTNLMDNAERHANRQITVTVAEREGQAVLEVLDDGAGVPPDKREVIFQRFVRLDAARSRDAGGTGLGLPIAREIAEEHGGSLRVEDSPVGARFVTRLPLWKGDNGHDRPPR